MTDIFDKLGGATAVAEKPKKPTGDVFDQIEAVPATAPAPPPVKPAISVPAPGRGRTSQTMLATGGMAFLGAALWMAWPRP